MPLLPPPYLYPTRGCFANPIWNISEASGSPSLWNIAASTLVVVLTYLYISYSGNISNQKNKTWWIKKREYKSSMYMVSSSIKLKIDNDFDLILIKIIFYSRLSLIQGEVLNLYHQLHSLIRYSLNRGLFPIK